MKRDPQKARAWRQRAKPLQRTPMRRGATDGAKAPRPREARIMRPVSAKMAGRRAAERAVRAAYKIAHPTCEMAAYVVMPIVRGDFSASHPGCTLIATDLHEPWSRAQGGPTDDPRNFAHLCRNCHDWITFTVEGKRWAIANGFRVAKAQGERWLAAGGRQPVT